MNLIRKNNYKMVIDADKKANCYNYSIKNDILLLTPQFVFIKRLRKAEYFFGKRKNNLLYSLFFLFSYRCYRKTSIKFGYSIPLNTVAKGLALPHYGTIIIHPQAKLGKNCMIHANVNIGMREGDSTYPNIGNNVYIGPGAKIFGAISIADNCYIGANTVVCKSIEQEFAVVVGIPGRVIKIETLCWWQKNGLNL